jgi:DNA-binding MarR family transcriptional regulator
MPGDAAVTAQPAAKDDDGSGHLNATDAVLSAARVLVGIAAQSIAAVEDSIGVNQFRALVIVASRGPIHLAGLAEAMGLHPSNATRTCDRLVTQKLLDRRENPADRRHLLLTLTKRGQELVDGVMRHRRQAIEHVLANMTVERQQHLAEVLAEFAEAGGEPAEQDLWSVGWITAGP